MNKVSYIQPVSGQQQQVKYYFGDKQQHELIIGYEENILCSLLLDDDSVESISTIINLDCFFTPSNKKIYKACLKLYENKKTINLSFLKDYLVNDNDYISIGGDIKIERILARASKITNVINDAKLLLDKFYKKELVDQANQLINEIKMDFNKPIEHLVNDAEERILDLKKKIKTSVDKNVSSVWSELAVQYAVEIADIWGSPGKQVGFKSGLVDLDNAVGGFMPGDFLMFAGPSGIGKTAFGCSLFYLFAKQNIPTLFLSGEMPEKQIAGRVMSCHTGIDSRLLTREYHKLTQEQVENLFNETHLTQTYPMSVKSCGAGITEIKTAIYTASQEAIQSGSLAFGNDGKFKIIFLDYLQLLAGGDDKSDNYSKQIDDLAKWCKTFALQNHCVIIAFAQINDSVLKRSGNRIPTLSDVGWCNTAKNHADYLCFLWTEYYNTVGTANELQNLPEQEILQLHFRKSRHTALSMVETMITRSNNRVVSVYRKNKI